MVLRRYVWPGFLAAEPQAAQREVDALGFAGAHSVPSRDLSRLISTAHKSVTASPSSSPPSCRE